MAQTLLFREFFASFESNEIAIGAFFAAWLGWISAGAFAGRFETRLHRRLASCLPAVALLYVPAFFLQQVLVAHARGMAGVESYDVFPLLPMLGMAFVVNAPVSFLTGFLFTLACRWAEQQALIPAARVYVLETLGSCAGGFFVTAAITGGMTAESVSIWAATVLVAAASLCYVAAGRLTILRVIILVLNVVLALFPWHEDAGNRLAEAGTRAAWSRLLPADEYRGTFSTAHGKYLYGQREGQFNMVSGGGVCESLPPGDHAAEVAAVHLAQRPDARSALVIGGDGLGICQKFLQLPQLDRVAWHHPDPQYPDRLMALLPPEIKEQTRRIQLLPADPTLETGEIGKFDLILLNVPDITTLALNRYVTEQYYGTLRGLLEEGGAVSVRVRGGSNFVGEELALQGSSVVFTLGSVFSNVTIKPGDETWVMASDAPFLYDPAGLQKRYESVPGAATMYPPENIPVVYAAGRVGFQMQAYRQQIDRSGEGVLLNTDSNPKALVYALLLAIKQAGLPSLAGLLTRENRGDFFTALGRVLVAGMILYALLRGVYLLKRRRGGSPGTFDSHVLILTTGMAGMALSVVLMFGYQSRFGSLFLDMGLVSALFMLGAFLGSAAAERALIAAQTHARVILPAALIAQAAVIAGLPQLGDWPSKLVWAAGFLASGMFTGLYFPLAAQRLKSAGRPTGAAGSNLELLDNLGGAAGAAVTGIILLPLLGLVWTSALLAVLVGVNLAGAVAGGRRAERASRRFDRLVRPAGYTLAGIGALTLFASQMMSAAVQPRETDALRECAQTLSGERPIQDARATPATGAEAPYFVVPEAADKKGGYIFSSKPWAGSLYGFAGLFELGVFVDETGELQGYEVISSSETPMYLSMVRDNDGRLRGRNVFKPEPFKGLDGIVGATVTDEAFREALALAGQGFARDVLELQGEERPVQGRVVDTRGRREFLLLAFFMLCGVVLTYWPRVWLRRGVLVASVLLLGLTLNFQYSTQQVMALLTLQLGRIGLNGPFFLLAAVPAVVLVFGNVYCGYVCPFGALQDLIGDVGVRLKLGRLPRRETWKYTRVFKWTVLFLLVVLFGVGRDLDVLRADPLISFFGSHADRLVAGLAFAALGISLVFGRFWCHNVCPSGAFLSLINGARLHGLPTLRRIVPARLPGRCDLGVGTQDEMDCICCDRCRDGRQHLANAGETSLSRLPDWVFVVAAAAMALAVVSVSLTGLTPATPAHAPAAMVQTVSGQPRDVDLEKVRKMVRGGLLSDHPADFTAPVTPNPPAP
ncbi:MAG TPA: 4Fe-4S binding protein [Candidatus Bathyarchaeia archaeon]|nr:4Fe-4S binding protein [Candidatus Bathyarchaeia archaeon]